jgi:hypothetical protein
MVPEKGSTTIHMCDAALLCGSPEQLSLDSVAVHDVAPPQQPRVSQQLGGLLSSHAGQSGVEELPQLRSSTEGAEHRTEAPLAPVRQGRVVLLLPPDECPAAVTIARCYAVDVRAFQHVPQPADTRWQVVVQRGELLRGDLPQPRQDSVRGERTTYPQYEQTI